MLKREIFSRIWAQIETDKILLLNGARQVGKTTLLKMIKEKLLAEKGVLAEQIFWFDLEKVEDLSVWSNQQTALALLPLKEKARHFIFIDEFQKSKNIGSILKVLHDHYPNFKIIVTGSASWYLTMDESLAGRKQVFPVWPLSFSEFIDWQADQKLSNFYSLAISDISKTTPEIISFINAAYLKFLIYGGYPAVVKSKSDQEKTGLLSELVNSYLLRDIQIHNYAANTLQVKKILTLLADRVGSLLDIHNLTLDSGLGRTALVNRLELLQNTFVLSLVRPYFTNKKKELVKNQKIYLVDSGIRNNLLANFSIAPQTKEFGQLAENLVVTEMFKRAGELTQIFYWRTKTGQEVDIVKRQENNLTPVEVKSGNESAVPLNLKSFLDKYPVRNAYVLNWSVIQAIRYRKTEVFFRPLWFLIQ